MIEIESKESSNLNGKWTRARRAGVGGNNQCIITGSWIFYTKDPEFPKILVGLFSHCRFKMSRTGFRLLGGVGTSKRLKILKAYPPTHLTPEKLAKKDTYPPT